MDFGRWQDRAVGGLDCSGSSRVSATGFGGKTAVRKSHQVLPEVVAAPGDIADGGPARAASIEGALFERGTQ